MKHLYWIIFFLALGSEGYNQASIESSTVRWVRSAKPFLHGHGNAMQLSLELNSIHVEQEVFWLCFSIRNRSGLSYPIDLIRLYLHDKTQAARSSLQELEIIPVYIDSLPSVPPKTNQRFVIAIPKFTIPDHKSFLIEIFEANGGRNLSMEITNWQLFKARPVNQTNIH